MTLAKIQSLIKAPKGQFNNFGKYKYRSCEDIVEAAKQVINPMGFYLTLTDEVVSIGSRFYVKATVTISNGTESYSSTAYAREEEVKKGMDGSQITGTSSSYARKYALNGLFAIDDTKDSDATNTHDKEEQPINDVPDESERQMLRNLVYSSDLNNDEREQVMAAIELCQTYKKYEYIQQNLENRQLGFDQVQNPSAKDINKKVKQIVSA